MSQGILGIVKRFWTLEDDDGLEEEGSRSPGRRGSSIVRLPLAREKGIKHHRPQTFEDVQVAADLLKIGMPVIITLENADTNEKRRMINFLSGVTYGIDGYARRINAGVFLFTPSNFPVHSTEPEAKEVEEFRPLDAADTVGEW